MSATTAQYIAMRVYREPDAFPSNNPWLRKALSQNGASPTIPELETHAESWRPWRAYAAMYLWDSFFDEKPSAKRLWDRESEPSQANQVA